jgi:AraC-like DNA-binding protein
MKWKMQEGMPAMRMDAGYFYGHDVDDAGAEHSFFVLSCGHYQLIKRQKFETLRREGRQDWQILYIAGGKAHFYLPDGEQAACEGEAFLYPPGCPQRYGYFLNEKPDVYWLHFSGTQAGDLMKKAGLPELTVFHTGVHSDCALLFDRIIRELQLCGLYCQETASSHAQALIYLLARGMKEKAGPKSAAGPEIQQLVEWIHRHPEESLPITDYARRASMSVSNFIRRFKAHTGLPPQQYITRFRMSHAKELLASSQLPITDIARIVGYDNPLYFSRMFKKETGVSPRAYRQARDNPGDITDT